MVAAVGIVEKIFLKIQVKILISPQMGRSRLIMVEDVIMIKKCRPWPIGWPGAEGASATVASAQAFGLWILIVDVNMIKSMNLALATGVARCPNGQCQRASAINLGIGDQEGHHYQD